MSKFPECHRHPDNLRRHFERSVPSVNDYPTIFNIFQKFYENAPCIQTISFCVTMFTIKWELTDWKSATLLENICQRSLAENFFGVEKELLAEPIQENGCVEFFFE